MKIDSNIFKSGISRLRSARAPLISTLLVLTVIAFLKPDLIFLSVAGFLLICVATFFVPRRQQVQRLRQIAKANRQKDLLKKPAKSIAEAFGFPIFVIDRERKLKFANSASYLVFGEVGIDNPITLKFRTPSIIQLIEDGIKTNQRHVIEYLEQANPERWFRVEVLPIPSKGRKMKAFETPNLFAISFTDLTHEKQVDQMRSDFIANASHELRTPLASLRGFIETLQNVAKNDENALEEFLPIMQEQSERMSRLIDDLLSLSRIEMKANFYPDAKYDVILALQYVLESSTKLLGDNCNSVITKIPETPVFVQGDREELIQVFSNLIENACKYGAKGGEIGVIVEPDIIDPVLGEAVEISITNGGTPIPLADIPRLTERFYRAQTNDQNTPKGTGLGLAIVKHIVNRHRGIMQITSDAVEGTRVCVRFAVINEDDTA